ncbi:hypothetical protein ACFZDJ_15240 [Streptomyces sp. NPDC007896]|uniref:hypothetical protein n=1 Tax=Streptomyces sp. NPDC007896 TaxID=3364784 RepID=UPI0036F08628
MSDDDVRLRDAVETDLDLFLAYEQDPEAARRSRFELERNRPLYADPFTGDTASIRLLERHGFQHHGTVRHGNDDHTLLVLPEE